MDIHKGEEGHNAVGHFHRLVVGEVQHRGGNHAGDDADDHALHDKGQPHKAVGGAHRLHDVDLHPAGEQGHLYRIGDNEQGDDGQQRQDTDAADAHQALHVAEHAGYLLVVVHVVHAVDGLDLGGGGAVLAQVIHGDDIGVGQGVIRALEAVEQVAAVLPGAAAPLVPAHAVDDVRQGVVLLAEGAGGHVVDLADLLADFHGGQGGHVRVQEHGDGVVALHRGHDCGQVQGQQARHAGHQQAGDEHADGGDTHGPVFPQAFQALRKQISQTVQAHGRSTSSAGSCSEGACSRRTSSAISSAVAEGASSSAGAAGCSWGAT